MPPKAPHTSATKIAGHAAEEKPRCAVPSRYPKIVGRYSFRVKYFVYLRLRELMIMYLIFPGPIFKKNIEAAGWLWKVTES